MKTVFTKKEGVKMNPRLMFIIEWKMRLNFVPNENNIVLFKH